MGQARNLMWAALVPYQSKGFTPESIMVFDWEKKPVNEPTEIPVAELEKVREEFAKIDAKQKS